MSLENFATAVGLIQRLPYTDTFAVAFLREELIKYVVAQSKIGVRRVFYCFEHSLMLDDLEVRTAFVGLRGAKFNKSSAQRGTTLIWFEIPDAT